MSISYDTAGNPIFEPISNCSCKNTGGCSLCHPSFIGCISDKEAAEMRKELKTF